MARRSVNAGSQLYSFRGIAMNLYEWEVSGGDWNYIHVIAVAEDVDAAREQVYQKYRNEYECDAPFTLDGSYITHSLPCALTRYIEIN